MPYYEYHCPTNGRTIEVRHGMNDRLTTWTELVERTGADAGDTPPNSPVERLMSAPVPLTGDGGAAQPGCGGSCACFPQA